MNSNTGFTFISREILGKLYNFPDIQFLGDKGIKSNKNNDGDKNNKPSFSERWMNYIKWSASTW